MPLGLYYEWRAYANLNPFGQVRDDWNAAMVAAVVHNALMSTHTKHPRRHMKEIGDLMFRPRRSRRRKTAREMYLMVRAWAMALTAPPNERRMD